MVTSRILPVSFPLTLSLTLAVFVLFPNATALAQSQPIVLTLRAADYKQTFTEKDISPWFHTETKLMKNPKKKKSEVENTAHCPTDKIYCSFSLSL